MQSSFLLYAEEMLKNAQTRYQSDLLLGSNPTTCYTFDELSKMTGHSFKLIKEGINYFVKSGMMEELPNDTYFIQDALDLTSQTKGAKYQQEYRATHEKPDKCKDKSKDKSK